MNNNTILRKIKNNQKNILTIENLRKYNYIPSRIEHGKILWHFYIPTSKSLEEKIKLKQKYITTNEDIRKYGYTPSGKRNGIQRWKLYTPKSKSLEQKINNKQKFISTNEDISRFGYTKEYFSKKNNIQIWTLEEYDKIYQEEYKKSHAESIKKRGLVFSRTEKRKLQMKTYYKNHVDERKLYANSYRKTPNGKLAAIRGTSKHDKKGFILLFNLSNIENINIEYHHIDSKLPFVIPVPKEIHRSISGRNPMHYSGVTQKFCKWLKENPYIEINPLI